MVCFRYIIVNTLHKSYDDNNTNTTTTTAAAAAAAATTTTTTANNNNTGSLLCPYTTSSVTCEHKNSHYPLDAHYLTMRGLHHYALAVSLWEDSIATLCSHAVLP